MGRCCLHQPPVPPVIQKLCGERVRQSSVGLDENKSMWEKREVDKIKSVFLYERIKE